MLTDDLETQIILLSFLIDIPCIVWLLYQYISGKEGTTYWLIVLIPGIIVYCIWTLFENPFIEFGISTTDIYRAESYLPLSKIAVSASPGLIAVVIIQNIRNIKYELDYYNNKDWRKETDKPKLITRIILFIKKR